MALPPLDIRRPQLPEALGKKAARLRVRECDQVATGHFMAYVDEADQSRDVQLECDANGLVTAASCDCGRGEGRLCEHIAAVVLHIAAAPAGSNGTPARKGGRKARPDPVAQLLDTVPPDALRQWMGERLAKDREWQLAFLQHFAPQTDAPTPEAMLALTQDARKAVLKNRKKAEPSEAKRIVDAWKTIHDPYVRRYLDDLTSPEAFAGFHAVLCAVDETAGTIHTSSTRLTGYLRELLRRTQAPLALLATEEAWQRAIHVYDTGLREPARYLALQYVTNLLELAESCREPRRAHLAERLALAVQQHFPHGETISEETLCRLLGLAMHSGIFDRIADAFEPSTWKNTYNLQLIDALARSGRLRRAADLAERQILNNLDDRHDLGYLIALRRIYRALGDTTALLPVIDRLLPSTFDIDDFTLLLAQQSDPEKHAKYRDKTLAMAIRQAEGGSTYARRFCREWLTREGRHRELIDLLQRMPYAYADILACFDSLFEADPDTFLVSLFIRSDGFTLRSSPDNPSPEELALQQTCDRAFERYGEARLRQAFHDKRLRPHAYRLNRFRPLVAVRLGIPA
jgi:hypothetical protein